MKSNLKEILGRIGQVVLDVSDICDLMDDAGVAKKHLVADVVTALSKLDSEIYEVMRGAEKE